MAVEEKQAEADETPATANREDRRKAARIATFVAIPVTIAALIGAVALLGSAAPPEEEKEKASDKPVEVKVPDLPDEDYKYCRALITKLPDSLGDLPRRVVSGDNGAPEVAGAWGDPAAKLRCGVEPVDVAKDADVYRLGPTCWFADESKKATTWTTVDRKLAVELRVPSKHSGPGQLVQALSKAVDDKIPAVKDAPSGCSA
ncbi:MAG: DUF3515 domain-containing protein [Stackebrandtia sp.]